MSTLLPLLPFLMAISAAILAARVYRRIYPYEVVRTAIDVIAEYRALESMARGKRGKKKLRTREPEYRRARRIIFRSTIVKFFVLTSIYMTGGIAAALAYPVYRAPFKLPLLTGTLDNVIVMPSFMLYFITFIYTSLVLRRMLL